MVDTVNNPEHQRQRSELEKQFQDATRRAEAAIKAQNDAIAKIREAQGPSRSRREAAFRRAQVGVEDRLSSDRISLSSQDAKRIADTIQESISTINPAAANSGEIKALQNQLKVLENLTKNLPDKKDEEELYNAIQDIKGELGQLSGSGISFKSGAKKAASSIGGAAGSGLVGLIGAGTGGNKLATTLAGAGVSLLGGAFKGVGSLLGSKSNSSAAAQIAENTKFLQAKFAESSARADIKKIGFGMQSIGQPDGFKPDDGDLPGGSLAGGVARAVGLGGSPKGILAELLVIAKEQKKDLGELLKAEKSNNEDEEEFRDKLLDSLDDIKEHLGSGKPVIEKGKTEGGLLSKLGGVFGDLAEFFEGGLLPGLVAIVGEAIPLILAGAAGGFILKWLWDNKDKLLNGAKDAFRNTVDAAGNSYNSLLDNANDSLSAPLGGNILGAIKNASKETGVGAGLLYAITGQESSYGTNKKARNATEITSVVWDDLIKNHPEHPEFKNRPTDPSIVELATALHIKDMQKQGIDINNPDEVYAAWMLGVGGYKKMKAAAGSDMAASHAASSSVQGNLGMFKQGNHEFSVDEFMANIHHRISPKVDKYNSELANTLSSSIDKNNSMGKSNIIVQSQPPQVVPVPSGGGSSGGGGGTTVVNNFQQESTYAMCSRANLAACIQ